jgi:hypothetical protein
LPTTKGEAVTKAPIHKTNATGHGKDEQSHSKKGEAPPTLPKLVDVPMSAPTQIHSLSGNCPFCRKCKLAIREDGKIIVNHQDANHKACSHLVSLEVTFGSTPLLIHSATATATSHFWHEHWVPEPTDRTRKDLQRLIDYLSRNPHSPLAIPCSYKMVWLSTRSTDPWARGHAIFADYPSGFIRHACLALKCARRKGNMPGLILS